MIGIGMALAGVASSAMSSSAAGKAADAQADAADKSAQVQWDMYEQTRADQGPYRDVGTNALYRMADHYGLGYGSPSSTVSGGTQPNALAPSVVNPAYPAGSLGSTMPDFQTDSKFLNAWMNAPASSVAHSFGSPSGTVNGYPSTPIQPAPQISAGPYSEGDRQSDAMGHFFTSPDYQFRLDEGIRGIENSMLARGKGLSGNTAKAITGYSGDLASGEWNNYMNRLASMAGIGQSATNQMGQYGANAAANIGNANIAAGQARGSGYIGQSDAWGNAFSNVGGMAGYGNWGGQPSVYGGSQYSPNVQSAYANDWWGR